MSRINDADDLFRLIDKIMDEHFSGAYKRQEDEVYNHKEDGEDEEAIDITEDEKYIYITIELRGLIREDFNVLVEPYAVILEFFMDGQWRSDKFKLPHKVKRKAKIEFNNCILDVILTKDKEKNGKNNKTKTGKSRGNSRGINSNKEYQSPEIV
jgi:HSP20 family molecular chaperone IbpA